MNQMLSREVFRKTVVSMLYYKQVKQKKAMTLGSNITV